MYNANLLAHLFTVLPFKYYSPIDAVAGIYWA